MNIDIWLLYLGTILLFMSTPGPSHVLMISVSMTNGFRPSLATAAGDLSANAIQILLAGFGLAAIVINSQYGFSIAKWAGVAYLVWMGVSKIKASFQAEAQIANAAKRHLGHLWMKGFITSAANPKAVVFFAALFPQFINAQQALLPQILVLGITYIVVDGMFLCFYGRSASWLASRIKAGHKRWIERLSGSSLIVAAIMLGMRKAA